MIKIFLSLCCACLLIQNNIAQDNFHVQIAGAPANTKIIIEYFFEDGWKNLATREMDASGQASLPSHFTHPGQYRLRLTSDPEKWGDFVIAPNALNPTKLNLKVDYKLLRKLPLIIEGNEESLPYSLLMPSYNQLTLNPDSLDRSSMIYLKREKLFFGLCDSIAKTFPNTFTGNFIAKTLGAPVAPDWGNLQLNKDSVLAFNSKHALDFVPFRDENVMRHIGLIRKLNLHYDYFEKNQIIEQYIDQVMTKGLANEEVSAWIFRFMLDKIIDHKDEKSLTYFLTWYSTDCTENEHTSTATRSLLTALEKNKPGDKLELLTLPDINNKMIPMKDVFAKNKITIIMFWKTNCSHCREFKPVLLELYKKYHAMGIEVYAIGTDKSVEEWKPVATSDNLPWPNVYLHAEARKDFNKRFPVPSTPTLMAVDSNGVILRRMIMRSKIESIMNEMLDEVNAKK